MEFSEHVSQIITFILSSNKKKMYKSLILIAFISLTFCQQCHYTCATCTGTQYYQCTSCSANRGTINNEPISGMCYCLDNNDENADGECEEDNSSNMGNKAAVSVFIALGIILGVGMMVITGMRYFLLKTLEDIQEVSLLMLLNFYFPQQFDIYLSELYRFNISSYMFEAMAAGTLFEFGDGETVTSTDGQDIYGKYKLLYKTANFFANQFTWMVVFGVLAAVGLTVWVLSRRVGVQKVANDKGVSEEELAPNHEENDQKNVSENKSDLKQQNNNQINQNTQQQPPQQQNSQCRNRCSNWLKILSNMFYYNIFITFFYLSLIETNINIFTQFTHLGQSGFAVFGLLCAIGFLFAEFGVIGFLWRRTQRQTVKPEWMLDHGFSACTYLIRTNYKTLTKYFWHVSCVKKILIALFLTTLYQVPLTSILVMATVQALYLLFAVYCEPHEHRYLRIHFYIMECFKLFIMVTLINYSQKYVTYVQMIQFTNILYTLLKTFFGFNFFYMLANFLVERKLYLRRLRNWCCGKALQGRKGYFHQGMLFLYERE